MNVMRKQTSHKFTYLLIAAVAVLLGVGVLLAQDATAASDSSCSLRETISNANGENDTTSGDCPPPLRAHTRGNQ